MTAMEKTEILMLIWAVLLLYAIRENGLILRIFKLILRCLNFYKPFVPMLKSSIYQAQSGISSYMKNRNNTDKHKDNGILLLKSDLVKYYQEVMSVGSDQTKKLFNSVYEEISEEFGFDVAIRMYQIYKGIQITFPTRLFNPEYVKKQVPIEYDGTNIKQLAKKYGYSEKTVRRMIKDL